MARKRAKLKVLASTLFITYLKKNILLIAGLSCIFVFSLWRYHEVRILSFSEVIQNNTNQTSGIRPIYIKSYPIGIDISVSPTIIKDGVWMIPPKSVAYLQASSGIGGGGNIIMYGHNRNEILGPIRFITIGSKIELSGEDGKVYIYEVKQTIEVDQDDLKYIQPTDTEVLTLYTCSGFLDRKRFIVRAIPVLKL